MNLSRRSFLQLLGVSAVATAVPVGGVLSVPPLPEVQPALLDAPVTNKSPIVWLEMNGQRYSVVRAQVDIENEYYDATIYSSSFAGLTPFMRQRFALEAWMYEEVDYALIVSGEPITCRFTMPGYWGAWQGTAYMTDFTFTMSPMLDVAQSIRLEFIEQLEQVDKT